MKERPILFKGAMVRALLDGSKTQTRRVVKSARRDWTRFHPKPYTDPKGLVYGWDGSAGQPMHCPYGQPGDRLWVRESGHELRCAVDHNPRTKTDIYATVGWEYSADGAIIYMNNFEECHDTKRRRPSIHMPRWASRITLEITGIRVERLQDISEADARAEGCTENHNGYFWGGPHAVSGLKQMATATDAYRDLWESINGPGSWDANPWVWVIEFKRITP